jgi:Flp pilus assembly protein TadD
MRILTTVPISIAACLLFLAFQARAQILPPETMDTGLGGGNTISGTVVTAAGGRLERRVNIRLQTSMRGDRITTTDEYGNFAFRGLVSGDYTLIIDKENEFEPFSQTVTVLQIRGFPPQTYNLSVRLVPKSTAQPKPGVVDAVLAELPQRGKDLYSKGQELTRAGDNKGAIEQLLLLTSEFPTFMFGFNELGVAYMHTNEFQKADAALQTAIKLQPAAFAPQMNRGIALVSLKRYADAETVLRTAKKLDEKSGPARYFLGTALANLGKFDEAENELKAATTMGGDEMKEAHRTLAIIYSSKGDKKKAAIELETYLQIYPTAPDAEQLKKVIEQLKATPTQSTTAAAQKPN